MGDLFEGDGPMAGRGRNPFTDDLKSFIDHVMRHYHVPSLSIGIVDGDETFINVSVTSVPPGAANPGRHSEIPRPQKQRPQRTRSTLSPRAPSP